MEFLSNLNWFGKSLVALGSLIPLLVLFNTFVANGMKPEVVVFAWFLGTIVGIALIPLGFGPMKVPGLSVADFVPTLTMAIVFILGITFGTVANLLLGQAIPISPNPAFPFAIVGSAGAVGYIVTYVAAYFAPKHFSVADFNWVNFAGVALLAVAMGMIMYRSPVTE